MSASRAGHRPRIVLLAGPNGAGKTTAAPSILRGGLRVEEFVNADTIARGLSAFDPQGASREAGRIMLLRLRQLASERQDFAFETTLASRTFAHWVAAEKATGYEFHLVYLWLPAAEISVNRVALRVKRGGHGVPEPVIRRRYARGLANFFQIYRPLATSWRFYDNSLGGEPVPLASGWDTGARRVYDAGAWRRASGDEGES